MDSFCYQIDLLSLKKAHGFGRDAIERVFFGDIDTRGANARNALMKNGPGGLTVDQRCDFARLLLSLEARRPVNVDQLRTDGRAYLAKELDADPEIRRAMTEEGIGDDPSEYAENQSRLAS